MIDHIINQIKHDLHNKQYDDIEYIKPSNIYGFKMYINGGCIIYLLNPLGYVGIYLEVSCQINIRLNNLVINIIFDYDNKFKGIQKIHGDYYLFNDQS